MSAVNPNAPRPGNAEFFNQLRQQLEAISPGAFSVLTNNTAVGLGGRLFSNSFITGSGATPNAGLNAVFDQRLAALDGQLDGLLSFGADGSVSPNFGGLTGAQSDADMLKQQQEIVATLRAAGIDIEGGNDLATLNNNINNAIAANPAAVLAALNGQEGPAPGLTGLGAIGGLGFLGTLNPFVPQPSLSALNIFGGLAPLAQANAQAPDAAPEELSAQDQRAIELLRELVGNNADRLNMLTRGMGGFNPLAFNPLTMSAFSGLEGLSRDMINPLNPFSLINQNIFGDELNAISA